MIQSCGMPTWRNGRRDRFKICSWQQGAGSSPVVGNKNLSFGFIGPLDLGFWVKFQIIDRAHSQSAMGE